MAYAGKSPVERMASLSGLNQTITNVWRQGGGTRDEALDAYSKIIGSGAVEDKDARVMLPTVMKAATAASAAPEQIAQIGIRSMQNFGFKAEDLPHVIDMAIQSGNMGGFELKNMAKWLPQQMAEAASLGMKGEKGFSQLLALNQVAATTAGNPEEAGNNVLNLLSKINSSDTQSDFKKLGINLSGSSHRDRLSARCYKTVRRVLLS